MTVLGTPLSASCGDGGAAAAAARGGSAPSAPRPPSAEGPQLSGSRGSDFGTPVNPDLLRQYQVANLQLQLQLQQLGIALGAETAEVKKLRATIVKLRTQTMRVKCDELISLREQVNDWKKRPHETTAGVSGGAAPCVCGEVEGNDGRGEAATRV